MRYTVEFKPSAARELTKLPRPVQIRLTSRIDALAEAPYPSGVEKVRGAEDLYRVRVADYRIVYQVVRDRLLVLVVRVGHRKEVYRHLP